MTSSASHLAALRKLTEQKAWKLRWEQDCQTAGHVLYHPADQYYAIVCLGRVRWISESDFNAFLCPDEAA